MKYLLMLVMMMMCGLAWTLAAWADEVPILVLAPVPEGAGLSPDQVQASALAWLGVATVVVGALATFAGYVIGKIHEIKAQVASQDARLNSQGERLHAQALATPTTIQEVESPRGPKSNL